MNKDKIIQIMRDKAFYPNRTEDWESQLLSSNKFKETAEEIHKLNDNQWISVDDILPEELLDVLCYDALSRETVICCYNGDKFYFISRNFRGEDEFNVLTKPMYWMPLPEPPKKVE